MFQQLVWEAYAVVSIPEPRVTLVQVAERAGVSKSTAGYVLTGQDRRMRIAEETRARVLRAAAEMNYRPNVMARSLRTPVTRPIAVISDTLATEAYGGELIEGCVSAAAAHGRLTFIGETRRDPDLEAALVEEFLAEQVEDFVFASVYPRAIAVPRALPSTARVVMLNCAATDPAVRAVLPDERGAGRMAAEVLLSCGVLEGIWLVGDRAPHAYAPGRDREAGLRETLTAAGSGLAGALDCAWEPESAYETLSAALGSGFRPAALLCMNDRVALGAYQALTEAALSIPVDVAVLAFEATALARWLRPGLTSIDRELHVMGRRAVDRLLAAEPSPGPELVPLDLRVRGSTWSAGGHDVPSMG